MRTSSLDIQEDKNKEDLDNRILKIQMEDANKAIRTLAMELTELQKLVINTFLLNLSILFLFLGYRISSTKTSNEFSSKSSTTITINFIIYQTKCLSLTLKTFFDLFFSLH